MKVKLLLTAIGLALAVIAWEIYIFLPVFQQHNLPESCCGMAEAGSPEGCSMANPATTGGPMGTQTVAQTTGPGQTSPQRDVFKQPVQSVFDNYIKIHGLLAQDSLEGVSGAASAMAKAIRENPTEELSRKMADQAEALGQAKNLEAARAAFKPLSESLIAYLKTQKIPAGSYYEAYCPMAKASWLQTDKTIVNPYMGKGMLRCGQIQT